MIGVMQVPMAKWPAGLYEWSPAVVGHLDRFWRGERGVQEVTQRRRHVAHAELDPKQRDLDYVRCVRQQPQRRPQQPAAPPTWDLSTHDMACCGSAWHPALRCCMRQLNSESAVLVLSTLCVGR